MQETNDNLDFSQKKEKKITSQILGVDTNCDDEKNEEFSENKSCNSTNFDFKKFSDDSIIQIEKDENSFNMEKTKEINININSEKIISANESMNVDDTENSKSSKFRIFKFSF